MRADNVVVIKSIKIPIFHYLYVKYNMDVKGGENWELWDICVTSERGKTSQNFENSGPIMWKD